MGWAPHLAVPTLLPLLFPDGVLSHRSDRRLVKVTAGLITVCVVLRFFATGPVDVSPDIENPAGVSFLLNIPNGLAAVALFTVVAPLAVVSVVRRQRAATGRERAQLQWLMVGGIGALAGATLQIPVPEPWGDLLFAFALLLVPVAIVVAVVRHGALDIEVVLNRAVVYALLSGLLLAAYAGTIVVVGHLELGHGGVPLAVVGLAALASAAAIDRVQPRRS